MNNRSLRGRKASRPQLLSGATPLRQSLRFHAVLFLGIACSLLTLMLTFVPTISGAPLAQSADPVIAAAGDIACDPTNGKFNGGAGAIDACRQKYTSDQLV